MLREVLGVVAGIGRSTGVDEFKIWAELRALWSRPGIQYPRQLKSIVLDSLDWFRQLKDSHIDKKARRTKSLVIQTVPRVSPRTRIFPRRPKSSPYLSRKQLNRIYDSAALLAQVHGTYLNGRIVVRPGKLGFSVEQGREFLARILKNAASRVREWSGGESEIHWIYAQAGFADPVIVGTVAVRPELLPHLESWLYDCFLPKCGIHEGSVAVSFCYSLAATDADKARYHSVLLKVLCSNIDPRMMVADGTKGRRIVGVMRIWTPARSQVDGAHPSIAPRVSETIGKAVESRWKRNGLPVLTPGRDGAWGYKNLGWELNEHAERCRSLGHRAIIASNAKLRPRKWTTLASPGWWQVGYAVRRSRQA